MVLIEYTKCRLLLLLIKQYLQAIAIAQCFGAQIAWKNQWLNSSSWYIDDICSDIEPTIEAFSNGRIYGFATPFPHTCPPPSPYLNTVIVIWWFRIAAPLHYQHVPFVPFYAQINQIIVIWEHQNCFSTFFCWFDWRKRATITRLVRKDGRVKKKVWLAADKATLYLC